MSFCLCLCKLTSSPSVGWHLSLWLTQAGCPTSLSRKHPARVGQGGQQLSLKCLFLRQNVILIYFPCLNLFPAFTMSCKSQIRIQTYCFSQKGSGPPAASRRIKLQAPAIIRAAIMAEITKWLVAPKVISPLYAAIFFSLNFNYLPPPSLQLGASKMGPDMQLFFPLLRSLAGEDHLSWVFRRSRQST